MNIVEVVILEHRWPRLHLQIKLPGGGLMEDWAHYDIAASQFEPKVKRALQLTCDSIIQRRTGIKPKVK